MITNWTSVLGGHVTPFMQITLGIHHMYHVFILDQILEIQAPCKIENLPVKYHMIF